MSKLSNTTKRPAGTFRPFATQSEFVAPGEPWDALETKLRPSDGAMVVGHTPLTRPAPRHENFNRWEDREYLRGLDMIEVQNWPVRAEVATLAASGFAGMALDVSQPTVGALTLDPPILACGNDDDIWKSVDGGYSWTVDLNVASMVWAAMAYSDYTAIALGTVAGAERAYAQGQDDPGAWYFQALADCASATCCETSSDVDLAWFGGERTTSSDPCIWEINDANHGGPDWTTAAATQISGSIAGSDPIISIAYAGAGGYAAACGETNLWKWVPGVDTALTAITFGTALGAFVMRSIVYDEGNAVFLIFCTDNASLRVYSLAPGASSATAITTIAGVHMGAAGAHPTRDGATARGSLVVCPVASPAGFMLASTHGFASCVLLPDPSYALLPVSPGNTTKFRTLGNRIAAGRYHAAGDLHISQGLRLGRPI